MCIYVYIVLVGLRCNVRVLLGVIIEHALVARLLIGLAGFQGALIGQDDVSNLSSPYVVGQRLRRKHF